MSQPNTPSPETNSNSTPSINAAAHAYQLAMQTQPHSATPPAASNNSGVLQMPGATRDVVMEDAPLHRPASPAAAILPPTTTTQTHSPILPPTNQSTSISTASINRETASPLLVPARTSTPVPKVNGIAENSSRATSQHPDTGPSLPTEASVHGAPARVYLNQTVTGSLLEGMKLLAKEQPKDPLRVLGEFLLSKSKELEGGN
ncbi:hypothetical protein SBOR_0047 [Sclerotinia borealis F-4128]|uniref:Dpy-30 domain-containing protein n=1 Tax=Sclerotinia borealis (strain F-4128) TaxID=1432307 RepID=W9CY26_SCLBF|nr:hypothetical protein SBOR_0047 [Sclerotinia borealis F-4128]